MKTFYTYLWLREDGTPYYVGKGSGRRAFIKRGHTCFPPESTRILIQEFPEEDTAFAAEIFLISFYGRMDKGTGCLRNLTDGGDGATNISEAGRKRRIQALTGRKLSEDARKRISQSMMGNTHGGKISEESRKKKSQSMIGNTWRVGTKHSEERKKEISQSMLGNTWNIGKKLSEEHRKKISQSLVKAWKTTRREVA